MRFEKVSKDAGGSAITVGARWRRVAVMVFRVVVILLLGGSASSLALYLAGNELALSQWLYQARLPLLLWRLTLYALVAGLWFHRVRAVLLRQAPSRSAISRLEVMMVCLALLIELTSYRWGL